MSDVSSASTASEMEEVVRPEDRMSEANALKEEGNNAFKAGDYDGAITHYENALKKLEDVDLDFEGCKALKTVLHSNLSASYLGISEPSKAISSAEDALSLDPQNKKAQYRRALARFNDGNLDDAKSDCIAMLEEDKNNNNVRMLLMKINKKIKDQKEAQKKAFGSIFDRAGGLYEDRATEMQNKKQRKYEDYTRQQREKGEEELNFEDWELLEEEEEKKREQERIEKVKAEEEKKRNKETTEAPKKKKESPPTSEENQEEESEVDEEDQKIIQETKKMGYCYFGKNKPEGNLTNQPIPQKIEAAATQPATTSKNSISSWNSKGTTYEEKDMSSWCNKSLREILGKPFFENDPAKNGPPINIVDMFKDINIEKIDDKDNLEKMQKLTMMMHRSSIKVTSVDDLECDAQIALIRGTKRYMFDFSCSLKLEVSIDTNIDNILSFAKPSDEPNSSVYEVLLTLSEVSSEMEKGKTYNDCMKAGYKDDMKPEHTELVKYMVEQFKNNVTDSIKEFKDLYQKQ